MPRSPSPQVGRMRLPNMNGQNGVMKRLPFQLNNKTSMRGNKDLRRNISAPRCLHGLRCPRLTSSDALPPQFTEGFFNRDSVLRIHPLMYYRGALSRLPGLQTFHHKANMSTRKKAAARKLPLYVHHPLTGSVKHEILNMPAQLPVPPHHDGQWGGGNQKSTPKQL